MTPEKLMNLVQESLELLPTVGKSKFVILIEIKATHISHFFNQNGYGRLIYLLDFPLLKQILIILSLPIKVLTLTLTIRFKKKLITNSLRNLIEKTLTMEDPRLVFCPEEQSQEMP